MKQKILASTTAIRTACGTMDTAINGLSGVVFQNDLFQPFVCGRSQTLITRWRCAIKSTCRPMSLRWIVRRRSGDAATKINPSPGNQYYWA